MPWALEAGVEEGEAEEEEADEEDEEDEEDECEAIAEIGLRRKGSGRMFCMVRGFMVYDLCDVLH